MKRHRAQLQQVRQLKGGLISEGIFTFSKNCANSIFALSDVNGEIAYLTGLKYKDFKAILWHKKCNKTNT